MSGPVLIAYDATIGGHLGLLDRLDLELWRGRSLHLLAVVTLPPVAPFEHDTAGLEAMALAAETAHAQVILDAQVERLRACGYDASGSLVRGPAVDGIVEEVQATDAALLVVAHARGRTWAQRWWQGCLPKALLDRSPCNVLVVMTG
jgi:nucleotide-binding universal stress UspA family protein